MSPKSIVMQKRQRVKDTAKKKTKQKYHHINCTHPQFLPWMKKKKGYV